MIKTIFSVLFLFLLPALLFAQLPKTSGKLKFENNQVIEVVTEIKTQINQEAMGRTIEIDILGGTQETYTAKPADNENTFLHRELKRIYTQLNGMGQNMSIDSDVKKDMEGPAGKSLKELLNKTYETEISPEGTILKVLPENIKQTELDDRIRIMADLMNEMMHALKIPSPGDRSFFTVLPSEGAAPGESWTEIKKLSSGTDTTVYTLTGSKETNWEISFTGLQHLTINSTMMGMQSSSQIKNNISGKVFVDKQTGQLRSKNYMVKSEGNTEIMGNMIPVSSESEIKITVSASGK